MQLYLKHMGSHLNDIQRFVAAVVVLLVMATVASRQLFLFAVFRDPQGLLNAQGGRYHLWLAISAGITACIAGGLVFHFLLRHHRNKWSKPPLAQLGPPLAATGDNPSIKRGTPTPFAATGWAQLNPWLLEGQADDRRPMLTTAVDSTGSASVRRSVARRSRQVNYKEWSKARHE